MLHSLDVANQFAVVGSRRADVESLEHDGCSFRSLTKRLPQFLRDERHERVEHFQQGIEEAERCLHGLVVDGLWLSVNVGRLDHLQIPCGELVPEQFVNFHQCFRYAVFRELVVDGFVCCAELGLEPFNGYPANFRLLRLSCLPSFHQSEGIPYLVVEVTSLFAEGLIEEDVVASRRREHHAHAHAVGTELLY